MPAGVPDGRQQIGAVEHFDQRTDAATYVGQAHKTAVVSELVGKAEEGAHFICAQ